MEKICIIGLGNMGNAMFGILSMNDNFEIRGCDREDPLGTDLQWCDTCIIAVKPQDFENLAKNITVDLSKKLVISIMAGVSIEKIEKLLNVKKIVRVMPNLALRVQKTLSGWIANKEVSDAEKESTKKLLREFGADVEVNKEEKIDMITALSGSGPAYFFRLAEILALYAKNHGFSKEESIKIAGSTFLGAAELLKTSGEDPRILREKVTSKGGTTAAAFEYMDSKDVEDIVLDGIDAARKRAKELNN